MSNKKVLIFGGSGLVGSKFIELNKNNFEIVSPGIDEVNILDSDQLTNFLGSKEIDTIINFAAFTDVGKAEEEKGDKAGIVYRLNSLAVRDLAKICKDQGIHLVQISTEYVFDGKKKELPYTEEDKPSPINWYGETKYIGEVFAQESGCGLSLVRISMPFRSEFSDKVDIARRYLQMLSDGQTIKAIEDAWNSPTFVDDIALALGKIVENKFQGLIHVATTTPVTPLVFSTMLAEKFGYSKDLITPISFQEFNEGRKAPLLQNSALDSSKFQEIFGSQIVHSVEEEVEIFKKQLDFLI